MVQFSSPAEAKKAHDCMEAILNNRFIKAYYLRKDFLPLPLSEVSLEVSDSHVLWYFTFGGG